MTVRATYDLGSWCILRMASASTLRVAQSLTDAGFEAWTPTEEIRKVVRGKAEWIKIPMLPTFVFADASRLVELTALARCPMSYQVWDTDRQRMVTKGTPFFRLFQVDGDIETVPERDLEPLRRIEGRRKRKPRGAPRKWQVGDKVRLTSGASEGLRGFVVAVQRDKVTISVPGSHYDFVVSAHTPVPDVDTPTDSDVSRARTGHQLRRAA